MSLGTSSKPPLTKIPIATILPNDWSPITQISFFLYFRLSAPIFFYLVSFVLWAFFLLLAKCIHPARTQCMPAFFHMLRSFLRPSMHAAFPSQFNFTEAISFSSLISSPFVTWQLLRQCHRKSIWHQLPYLCIQPTSHTSPLFYIQSVWTQDAQDRSQSPSINGPPFLRCLVLQHPYEILDTKILDS